MFLVIPDAFKGPVLELIELPEATLDSLTLELSKSQPLKYLEPSHAAKSLAAELNGKVEGLSNRELSTVLRTLMTLLMVARAHDTDSEDFVEQLFTSFEDDKYFEKLTKATIERAKPRLTKLLLTNALATLSKAFSVLTDHQRTLKEVRILSDLRPIFGAEPNFPTGAVVVHMLKLTYMEEGRRKEFFVALDNADLEEMSDTLKRAAEKTVALEKLCNASNVPYLSILGNS